MKIIKNQIMSNNNLGRKTNSTNKLSKSTKDELFENLKPHLKDLGKNLHKLSFEERITQIKHFSKILAVGDDEVANSTRELIWEGLQEHFKKMRFYFCHVKQEKKISELRQFLKLLPPSKLKESIEEMVKHKNFSF